MPAAHEIGFLCVALISVSPFGLLLIAFHRHIRSQAGERVRVRGLSMPVASKPEPRRFDVIDGGRPNSAPERIATSLTDQGREIA